MATVGLVCDDGAVIGASALGLEMRPGLQKGGDARQPEGQDAGVADVQRGIWSGVMVRPEGLLSDLPEHSGLAMRRHFHEVCSFAFPKELPLLLSGPPEPSR